MTDDAEDSAVAPPFDVVPVPDEPDRDSSGSGQTGTSRMWPRWALVALFVAALGFGQGFGLTFLFGRGDGHLSTAGGKPEEILSLAAADHAAVPAGATAANARTATDDELVVARDRFEMGDIEGARRLAACFLLRLDGLGRTDNLRASEAYVLLADVLRNEYERSLLAAEVR